MASVGEVLWATLARAITLPDAAAVAKDWDFLAPVDLVVVQIGDAAGFPEDKVRFLLCMFASFPLVLLHGCLPSTALRHAVAILIGAAYTVFSFRHQALHSLVSATVTYVLILVLGRSPLGPPVVCAFNLGYMFLCHLHQQLAFWGAYQLDFTGLHMVLTIKMTQVAFNVYDGSNPKASETQKRWGLPGPPSPLLFLSYVYYFPSLLAGPAFEISDFQRFMEGTLWDDDKGRSRWGEVRSGAYVAAGLKLASVGLLFGGVVGNGKFPAGFALTDEYLAYSLPARIGYLWISGGLYRFPYYLAWVLADSACTLAGLGYNGSDAEGKPRWDRVSNCDVVGVETAQSVRVVMAEWNKGTNHWLRHYVYERLLAVKCPRGLATLATFLVSAFWHGFYAGYYVTFFCGSLAVDLSRDMRTVLRPRFADTTTKKTPLWYNALGAILSSFILNEMVIPFVLLDLSSGWIACKRVYCIPQVGLLVLYGTFRVLASRVKRPSKKE